MEQLKNLYYWDARILKLDATNYVDEINLVYEDLEGNVDISFSGCLSFHFSTSGDDRIIPLKEMRLSQIPYFIQDIEISDSIQDDRELLACKIVAPPMIVGVLCNSMTVSRK